MTNKISFNELSPKRIRKIHTGSELLFAYELSKYARIMLGKELVLDVTIAKELLQSEQYTFVVQNGLNVGYTPDRAELLDISRSIQYYFKGTVEGLDFQSQTPEEVVYNYYHNTKANSILNTNNRSTGYVSMVAYLIVKAYSEGVAAPKIRIAHEKHSHLGLEYVDLLILQGYGNKILEDRIVIEMKDKKEVQPAWEAFVIYHRQRGSMNREYLVTDKYRYLKKNFEVGDVVLLYKRGKPSQNASGSDLRTPFNLLKSCYTAVISYFDQTTVKLTYFPINQTRLTRHIELSEVDEAMMDEERTPIYTEDDYTRFDMPTVTFNLADLGVDSHTWLEPDFFIKPVDTDGSQQYFKTNEGVLKVEHLSTLDTIYAIFEDQGVDYNKEKFLAEYFKGRTPVYDLYNPKEQK